MVRPLDENTIFPSVKPRDVLHSLVTLTLIVVTNIPPPEPVEQSLIATKFNMELGES